MKPIIVVHGGAAEIAQDRVHLKLNGVKWAAHLGNQVLAKGGSALDAIETAIRYMEEEEPFNAGYGSVLNLNGEVEMDASIMDGGTLNAGAVTLVKDVKHPVSLARCVMEKSQYVLLAAHGTSKFAQDHEIPMVPPSSLVSEYAKKCLEIYIKGGCLPQDMGMTHGTVGAVAIDKEGHLAAATSTGGANGQLAGRIGDIPQIGSGTYADDKVAAVSCTGHGESNVKWALARAIIKDIEYNMSPYEAARSNIEALTKHFNREAGTVIVSKDGEIGIHFTAIHMPWAYEESGIMHFGVRRGQHDSIPTDQLKPL